MDTLREKYKFPNQKPNMPYNKKIRLGWFTANNQVLLQKYLNNVCKGKSIVIEFGTWLGVSANFIADNISNNSTLICVDWWKGDTSIGTREDEDELYKRYIDNVWNNRKKIIPVRMDGRKAAEYISKLGIQPDLIYLDMGHSYEEVIGDLDIITKSFPKVIIVGDDYLYWPGVRKAVLETRYLLDIPYLNVDKNCYALLYEGQEKYMTYDNDVIGRNTKRFYDKTVHKYSTEEIQYSLQLHYKLKMNRVFIIPIYQTKDINKYENILKKKNNNDTFIIVLSKKKESLFSLYNYGYIYFKNHIQNKKHSYVFIYIDPSQIADIDNFKPCEGFLSITTTNDYNQEVYSSLGNMMIDESTMKKIEYFPHGIQDELIYRFFLFKTIIKNKIIIQQYFVDKKINNKNIDWDKIYKSLSLKKKKHYKIFDSKPNINLVILDQKKLSDKINIIIV